MFLEAARTLAEQVTDADLGSGSVYPELRRIRSCSRAIACAVVRCAVREGHASPELLDGLEERVTQATWWPDTAGFRYTAKECESGCATQR